MLAYTVLIMLVLSLPAPFHGADKVLGYGLALAALWYFGGLVWRLQERHGRREARRGLRRHAAAEPVGASATSCAIRIAGSSCSWRCASADWTRAGWLGGKPTSFGPTGHGAVHRRSALSAPVSRSAEPGPIAAPPAAGPTGSDPFDQLAKLAQRRDRGAVAEAEFEREKAKLVSQM